MNGKEINIKISTTHYQVVVQGELGANWSDWLGNVLFESQCSSSRSDKTTIILAVPDQVALRGLLNKLWDLNLRLISVNLHGSEC
jgi:hypothetical protein